jgi:hypothetical protein
MLCTDWTIKFLIIVLQLVTFQGLGTAKILVLAVAAAPYVLHFENINDLIHILHLTWFEGSPYPALSQMVLQHFPPCKKF